MADASPSTKPSPVGSTPQPPFPTGPKRAAEERRNRPGLRPRPDVSAREHVDANQFAPWHLRWGPLTADAQAPETKTTLRRPEVTMARRDRSRDDGGRKRCLMCGHPKLEHRGGVECTVPKCICEEYTAALSVGEAPKPT
jgi:hypothetical protein